MKDLNSNSFVNSYSFLDDASSSLNHTREDELKLRQLIIDRDPNAVSYGVHCFNPSFSGTMSKNTMTQYLYMAVGSITLVTRYAIDGGMPESRAYAISDAFLQILHNQHTTAKIIEWYRQALIMFVSLMPATGMPANLACLAHNDLYSPLISQTINYCINNLHRPLSVKGISCALHVTPSYLSHLFHSDTGVTITKFIRELKIETAKELLRHSKKSGSEIAFSLGYSSQSHFIKAFKEGTGVTPAEYLRSLKAVN